MDRLGPRIPSLVKDMAMPIAGSGPGRITEIPTPEEFEQLAAVGTEPAVEQITQVILSQLSAKSELPTAVIFEIPWWKAPYVPDALARFEERRWKTSVNKCVSIFGVARFEIEFSK